MSSKLQIEIDVSDLLPEEAHSIIFMGLKKHHINPKSDLHQKICAAITILAQLRACKFQKDSSPEQISRAVEFHKNLARESYNQLVDMVLDTENNVIDTILERLQACYEPEITEILSSSNKDHRPQDKNAQAQPLAYHS